jgi:predicted small lipoprotein YifL
MKKVLSIIFVLVLSLSVVLTGCGKKGTEDQAVQADTKTSDKPLKIALILNGNLGDKSFFDSSNAGLEQIKSQFSAETKLLQVGSDQTKWEPTLVYDSSMLRLYEGNFVKKVNTEDTYIFDWLYRELDTLNYVTEYEISAYSTVENYHKITKLRTYQDVIEDGGFNGNLAEKSQYEFDLSDLSSTIATNSWADEQVESVVPDALYVRPIIMSFYDKKVTYGDYLKVVFTYDGNKIVKSALTDISDITDNNDKWDWWELKKTNLQDKKLVNTYNLLVVDIRTCYLLSNDLENKIYKNTKILSFKNKRDINKKEISQLEKSENCLKNFDKYNSLVLSDNQDLSNKIKNQINIIIDYNKESSTYEMNDDLPYEAAFLVMLNRESDTISKIASLTSWLKTEYNSYK